MSAPHPKQKTEKCKALESLTLEHLARGRISASFKFHPAWQRQLAVQGELVTCYNKVPLTGNLRTGVICRVNQPLVCGVGMEQVPFMHSTAAKQGS